MSQKKIYFDYAATTPLDPRVLKAMMPYLKNKFGNASSLHSFGQDAVEGVDLAREKLAKFLHCEVNEVYFTSGATESNNWVFKALPRAYKRQYKVEYDQMEMITTEIEHPCVLESARFCFIERNIKVHYLPVAKEGIIDLKVLKKTINDKTVLISIMYVNNEIGTIQPIAEIGKLVKEINLERAKRKAPPLYFHTDAVQAVNYLDCDVKKLGVDFLSLSGHKIYGSKGVGALYIRKSAILAPFFHGGHQEYGKRAGTSNVAGIVGLGAAVDLLQTKEHKAEIARIKKMRDKIITTILKKIPQTQLNGSKEKRLPNNVNITFVNAEGESILMKLDMLGIAVSTGSACASGSLNPSHVILSIGVKPEHAHGSVRFTLGRYTKEREVDYLLKVLPGVIKDLRRMSPLKM